MTCSRMPFLKCALEEVKCDEVKRREMARMTTWDINEDFFTYSQTCMNSQDANFLILLS